MDKEYVRVEKRKIGILFSSLIAIILFLLVLVNIVSVRLETTGELLCNQFNESYAYSRYERGITVIQCGARINEYPNYHLCTGHYILETGHGC